MANRQRSCAAEETRFAAEETRLRSRRNAEGTEMRGLKRQTGVLTDEATRLAGEETCRKQKHAGRSFTAVGAQQFRADNSPHLRLFYL